jgi:hypothetical protein
MTRADPFWSSYVTLYVSPIVTVRCHATAWDVYRVEPSDGKARMFRGETAWADAARYAYDHDHDAINCTS